MTRASREIVMTGLRKSAINVIYPCRARRSRSFEVPPSTKGGDGKHGIRTFKSYQQIGTATCYRLLSQRLSWSVHMRRTLLALSLIAGITSAGLASAKADVAAGVGPGGGSYWQQYSPDHHWRERREWREAQQERRSDWLYNHCVRDWHGGEYCR